MSQEPTYTIPSTVMLQKVDDETLLFDSSTQLFFTLNDVGAKMWEVISRNTSMTVVMKELLDIYDIPEEQLKKDLYNFLVALSEQGLIQ